MFKYESMREALIDRIPEVLQSEEYSKIKDFWKDELIPIYCYYELLEHLFHKLLHKEIEDEKLLNRVIDFMEEMASSEDEEVRNLLEVQILESLFGLNYTVFHNMETNLFRANTKLLFEKTKKGFISPKPYE